MPLDPPLVRPEYTTFNFEHCAVLFNNDDGYISITPQLGGTQVSRTVLVKPTSGISSTVVPSDLQNRK